MKAKANFGIREICGQYVIMPIGESNLDFTDIIGLNETAAFVWNKIAERDYSLDELQGLLSEKFTEVAPEQLRDDLEKLEEQFKKLNIIEL